MCRLFGFRSAVNIGVHHSLVLAENALALQSDRNPDGWGIGFFEGQVPVLRRGVGKAIGDDDFGRLARFVRSSAVIAHVRLATFGDTSIANTHPFSHGQWVFAHNGTLRQLDRFGAELDAAIAPELRQLIRGDTDSERCFYLYLTELKALGVGSDEQAPNDLALIAMERLVSRLLELSRANGAQPPAINFIACDGRSLAAVRLGRGLFFSTQKRYCEKMDECSRWQAGESLPCMHPLRVSAVNHILVASEKISAEDIWEPFAEGDLIGIDADFNFVKRRAVTDSAADLERLYAPFYTAECQDVQP
jgi:glutamine amidotransferase